VKQAVFPLAPLATRVNLTRLEHLARLATLALALSTLGFRRLAKDGVYDDGLVGRTAGRPSGKVRQETQFNRWYEGNSGKWGREVRGAKRWVIRRPVARGSSWIVGRMVRGGIGRAVSRAVSRRLGRRICWIISR